MLVGEWTEASKIVKPFDGLQSANDMWNYDSYDENKRSLSNHALPTANCIGARTVLVDAVAVAIDHQCNIIAAKNVRNVRNASPVHLL
jgi:hypothetical protein